jgi:hypothetical protein
METEFMLVTAPPPSPLLPSSSSQPTSALSKSLKGLLRKSGKSKGFLGLKPIRVRLFSPVNTVVSTAATALSAAISVPFSVGEFPEVSSLQTLYDEVRILKIYFHFMPYVSAPVTAGDTFDAAYAIEFDPSVSAPSSVNTVMESSHMVGPLFVSAPSATGVNYPSLQKYHTLSANLPAPLVPVGGSDCIGRGWFTVDGTSPIVAVLNLYHTAMGTGGISNLRYYLSLDCEFKMRT